MSKDIWIQYLTNLMKNPFIQSSQNYYSQIGINLTQYQYKVNRFNKVVDMRFQVWHQIKSNLNLKKKLIKKLLLIEFLKIYHHKRSTCLQSESANRFNITTFCVQLKLPCLLQQILSPLWITIRHQLSHMISAKTSKSVKKKKNL